MNNIPSFLQLPGVKNPSTYTRAEKMRAIFQSAISAYRLDLIYFLEEHFIIRGTDNEPIDVRAYLEIPDNAPIPDIISGIKDKELPKDSLAFFPVRLFCFLFSYRFLSDTPRSLILDLGEKVPTNPRKRNGKHSCNTPQISVVMSATVPFIPSLAMYNPTSKNLFKVFLHLEPRADSEFLKKEIEAIHNDPRHFLHPLVTSYLETGLARIRRVENKQKTEGVE